jgi:hypothetical protein
MIGDDDEIKVSAYQKGRIEAFPAGAKASDAPWPSVIEGSPSRVYWVSKGRLVRRKISNDGVVGPLEILVSDAADYTRVVAARAPEGPAFDVVAYIGRKVSKEFERSARVWIEGKGSRRLSAEGAGATSVSAVAVGEGKYAMLSLDGRLSLSPMHARFLEVDASGAPRMNEDHVVYIAGPAEGQVDLFGLHVGSSTVAFVPISRDTSTFGMLTLTVTAEDGEAPSRWFMYPNGVTPAPVSATTLCDKPVVAYVQPEDASAGAKKVVVIGQVDEQGNIIAPTPIAVAPTIRHLAFASIQPIAQPPAKGGKPRPLIGALIAYTSDNVLRARAVPCR